MLKERSGRRMFQAMISVGLMAAILSFSPAVMAETCCQGSSVGDIDCSGSIDIGDVSRMVDHLFLTLTPLCCKDEANFNYPGSWYTPADTIVDVYDLQLMIDGQFISMRPYPPCPGGSGGGIGSLVDMNGCKQFTATAATAVEFTEEQSCLVWDYSNEGFGTLTLTHINAGFNCCPTLDVSVDVENGTITLHEVETLGECFCLCLFDLEYEITFLPPGNYRIVAEEPYVGPHEEPLDTYIDLTATPSGTHCVERTEYPWGVFGPGEVSE